LTDLKVQRAAIDYLLDLLNHESMSLNPPSNIPPDYGLRIRNAFQQTGFQVTSSLLTGMVTEFEDTSSSISAFRLLAEKFPNEFVSWLPAAVEALPPKALTPQDSQKFLQDFGACVQPPIYRYLRLTHEQRNDKR